MTTSNSPTRRGAEPPANWRILAREMLDVLKTERTREWGFTQRERLIFPVRGAPAPGEPGIEFDDLESLMGHLRPDTPRRSDYRPRPALLLAVLRLARTFGTQTALWSTLCAPGATILITTGRPEMDDVVKTLLMHLIQGQSSWEARRQPQVVDVAAALADSDTVKQNDPLLAKLSQRVRQTLTTGAPLILVGSSATGMPAALQALGPREVKLAPMTPEIVLEYLRGSYGDGCCDLAEAADDITQDMTDRMTLDDLVLAVRAPCGAQAARMLGRGPADPAPDGPGFAEFPLPATVREPLEQVLMDLADWRSGRLPWRDVSQGVMLWGPPGTGKTEIARILAREANIAVHAGSVARWQASGSRGSDTVREMRALFERAAADAPCILFIDELDALGDRARRQDHNSAWTDMIVAAFLECMDGFDDLEGVVVIAATNHLYKIDAAIRRPGRFDKVLHLSHPGPDLLPGVLRWHLWPDLAETDVSDLAARLMGMSGAEIAGLVRDARARARREARPVGMPDLEAALAAQRAPASPETQWQIAIHEAGHAVLAAATGRFVPKVLALICDGGVIEQERTPGSGRRDDIEAELMCILAGRAAETLVFGDPSQGAGGPAGSDLAQATELAAALEISYGLGQSGPVWLGQPTEAIAGLRIDTHLRQRVRRHLERAEIAAVKVLKHNRAILDDLAALLCARGVVSGPELGAFLAKAGALSSPQTAAVSMADIEQADTGPGSVMPPTTSTSSST